MWKFKILLLAPVGQNDISEWPTKYQKGLIKLLCQNVVSFLTPCFYTSPSDASHVCLWLFRESQIVIYIPVKCFDSTESPLAIRLVFYQKIFNKFYSWFPNTLDQFLLNVFLLYFFGNPIIFPNLVLGYDLACFSSWHGLSTQILWKICCSNWPVPLDF